MPVSQNRNSGSIQGPLKSGWVRQRGQAAVEFALTALILFFILFGIIEVGRLVLSVSDVNNAAREGAHYLALNPRATVAQVLTQTRSTLVLIDPSSIQPGNLGIDCNSCGYADDCAISPAPTPCTDYSYQPESVALTYTWTSLVPLPVLSNGLTLVGRSTTLRER